MNPTRGARRGRLAALAAGLALALGGCHSGATEQPPPPPNPHAGEVRLTPEQRRHLRTEPAARTEFLRTIEATGTVAFDQNRSTQILAPISGPVTKLLVGVGDRVRREQAVAVVASPDYAADVSALRKTEAVARNARRVADTDELLFKNDAIARRDMEQAQSDAVGAEADRDAALQQLRALGVEDATITAIRENRAVANPGGILRSPIAGTVVERLITPGELLQGGTTPCFTIADLSRVWVLANIFEADLPYVAVGDPATVLTTAERAPLRGAVTYIAALVDPNTRAIAVRLDVENPGEVLKRDLYVQVAIRARRPSLGLTVPVSAVLRDDENLPFVFVAQADDTFARRRVQLGARSGDRQEVASGLQAGEPVVVEGGLFLQTAEAQ
ncbi:MAG TPA: efflux RND transporter periplasmic adaptor subunit [Thermoanaerobaculia bacterium]|jgi:cobalt-zinc-cadmium efflux system membrane fusion protein|nr:efflux RND transporter periplasmic adaptor subunit [Thermoanaerobaculia bacterium]